MKIKISITDDHPLVASGLKNTLDLVENIEVIATYTSGMELLEGLRIVTPDVILTDLQMPGKLYGFELVKQLRKQYPEIPLLILSGQEAVFNVHDMMTMGCSGYLLKNTTDKDMLVKAIEQVYKGELFLETSLRNDLLKTVYKAKNEVEKVHATISRREKEVLQLIGKGYSSQQMADELSLSIRTINSHRLSLLQKLEVKNAVALVKKATEIGLI